jgi:beta-ketoacyl-acyl-carrier-protein synthase II
LVLTEKVVITGQGAVSPLGLNARETWENAIKGVSGIGPITLFDTKDYLVRFACEVKNFLPENYLPSKEIRRRDRFEQLATVAAQEAVTQAGLEFEKEDLGRVAVTVSSAIGGLRTFEDNVLTAIEGGPRRVSPFVIPMLMVNGASGMIAIDQGIQGPCFSVTSACASGADGIGIAWMMIRAGLIDVAIAGGTDATITPVGVAAFDRLGAVSRRDSEHLNTPQPFDLNRDGLVMGEGAAVLVIEKESRARERGATILAELAGYAATADAYHITAPSEHGAGGSKAMRLAMSVAGIGVGEVDYINAHGTATTLNDISETKAIKAAFGERAYDIPISSTKSMTGHMMGATGALEAIFCVQATRENIIPPTINYETPDPECDLDYVPNLAREEQVRVALSNAFGFGGHNAVLVIREYN